MKNKILKSVQTKNIKELEVLIAHGGDMRAKDPDSNNNLLHVALLTRDLQVLQLIAEHAPQDLFTKENPAGNNAFDQMILINFHQAFDILYPKYEQYFRTNPVALTQCLRESIRLHKGPEMVANFLRCGVEIDKDIVKYAYYYDRGDVIDLFKSQNANLFADLGIAQEDYEGYLSTTTDPELLKKSKASEISIAIRLKKSLAEIQELFRADNSALLQPDNFGTTALHEAAYYGRLDVLEWIKELESAGVKVDWNAPDDFYNTPLHNAIFANQFEAARLLLQYGASYVLPNTEGDRPFNYLIEAGFDEIVAAVYDDKSFDDYSKLVFDLAKIDEGAGYLTQICDYVVCAFANPRENRVIKIILKGIMSERYSIEGGVVDDSATADESATIAFARAKSDLDDELLVQKLEALIVDASDIRAKDPDSNNNLLHVALLTRDLQVLQFIAEHAPQDLFTAKNLAGNNAFDQMILINFHQAFDILYPKYEQYFRADPMALAHFLRESIRLHKGTEMVEKFLNLGVKIGIKTLARAYYYDRGDVVDLFKSQNPYLFADLLSFEEDYVGYLSTTTDPELLKKSKASEISIAIRLKKPLAEIQELFIADNSALLQPDNFGTTALHEAAYYGRLDVLEWIKELKSAGVKVDWSAQDRLYNTPLHNAIFANQFEAARLLLQYGANPLLPNTEGDRPVDYAIQASLEESDPSSYDAMRFSQYCQLLADLASQEGIRLYLNSKTMLNFIHSGIANPRENPAIEAILKKVQLELAFIEGAAAKHSVVSAGDCAIDFAKAQDDVFDELVERDVPKVGELAPLC